MSEVEVLDEKGSVIDTPADDDAPPSECQYEKCRKRSRLVRTTVMIASEPCDPNSPGHPMPVWLCPQHVEQAIADPDGYQTHSAKPAKLEEGAGEKPKPKTCEYKGCRSEAVVESTYQIEDENGAPEDLPVWFCMTHYNKQRERRIQNHSPDSTALAVKTPTETLAKALVNYEAMVAAIDGAHMVDEVKEVRDQAIALASYKQIAQDEDSLRKVQEIRVRAERRAGEILAEMKTAGQRDQGAGGDRKGSPSKADDSDRKPKPVRLKDLGISRDESSQWQMLATVPEKAFTEMLATSKAEGTELTQSAVKKSLKRLLKKARGGSSLPHDPKAEKEDERMREQRRKLAKEIIERGLKPYRRLMKNLNNKRATTLRVVESLLLAYAERMS
jgi:hypothetical protein